MDSMKKVYVAGSTGEREMVSRYMDCLRAKGIEITLDWTPLSEGNDAAITDAAQEVHAKADLVGVATAGILWVMVPTTTSSRGCWVEFGYALGRRECKLPSPITVVSGQFVRSSIFTALSDHRLTSHDAALAKVIDLAAA